MRIDIGGNEYMDGDDGPIFREVRADGALVLTQGDIVWVTPDYVDPVGGYDFESLVSN